VCGKKDKDKDAHNKGRFGISKRGFELFKAAKGHRFV